MADFNKTVVSQSSPIHPSSGNNENESENQRNLHPKNKNFMSPTISTASKFTPTPKKKILSEWKSPKSLPKVPKNVVNSHKNHDNDAFLNDSFGVPYDPLTNYLSPRPRFLRYRPNRRREIVVKSDSDSLTDSVGSTLESESGENVVNDEHSVVDENEFEEELEEENSGLKWGLVKFLMVFLGLVFGTMWISGMHSSVPRLELRGFKNFDEHFMNVNLSSRVVSLSSLDFGMMGVFEWDEKAGRVDRTTEVVEAQELNEDSFTEAQVVLEEENVVPDSKTEHEEVEIDAPTVASVVNGWPRLEDLVVSEVKIHGFEETASGLANVVLVSKAERELVEVAAQKVASGPRMESLGVSEVQIHDSEANFSDVIGSGVENATVTKPKEFRTWQAELEVPNSAGLKTEYDQVKTEAQMVASGPIIEIVPCSKWKSDRTTDEKFGVGSDTGTGNSEVKSKEIVPGFEWKSDRTMDEEFGVDSDTGAEISKVKPKEGGLANDVEVVPEEKQSETSELEQKLVKKQSEYMPTFSDLIWSAISPLIAFGLLASLVLKFYCKCKRVSSKTRSSNVKLCTSIGKTVKTRAGLPPRSVEKTDHSEVKPPSSIIPQDILDMDNIHTIIPRVKQLGEFEVGVEFTQSLKSCSANETVFSTPDTKRVALRRSSVSGRASTVHPSSSELSTTESYSCGSYISQDRTSMKDVKEEVNKVTPTRRSTRLRNKGLTSP